MTTEADRQHGEQVRARLAAATPGPWEAWENTDAEPHVSEVGRGYFGHIAAPSTGMDDYGRANAELIAHAPDDLARLLDRAEKAEQESDAACRAAVVKALRSQSAWALKMRAFLIVGFLDEAADAIENGEGW